MYLQVVNPKAVEKMRRLAPAVVMEMIWMTKMPFSMSTARLPNQLNCQKKNPDNSQMHHPLMIQSQNSIRLSMSENPTLVMLPISSPQRASTSRQSHLEQLPPTCLLRTPNRPRLLFLEVPTGLVDLPQLDLEKSTSEEVFDPPLLEFQLFL